MKGEWKNVDETANEVSIAFSNPEDSSPIQAVGAATLRVTAGMLHRPPSAEWAGGNECRRSRHNDDMETQLGFTWEKSADGKPPPTAPEATPAQLTLPARPTGEVVASVENTVAKTPHKMTWEEKQAKAHDMTDQALARLAEALAAGHSDGLKAYLTTMAKFHSYSFGNQILIACQNPQATHVAGFHAWKKFGRSVKKGESGIMVMAPITRKVGEKEALGDDGSTRREDVRQIVNVKPVYVFDVTQTEGAELPAFARVKGEPAEHRSRLLEFIAGQGIEVHFAEHLGGALGLSEGKKIQVLSTLAPADEFHVLAHELAHELLHRGERREETTRKVRELEAEAVAFVVCTAVGLDAQDNSADYIHLYRGSVETLTESLQFIRRTASEILAAITAEKEAD